MTERRGQVNKLFIIWSFLVLFLKEKYNKNTGANLPHPLARYGSLRRSYLRSIRRLVFLSVIENIVELCPSLLLFSPTRW